MPMPPTTTSTDPIFEIFPGYQLQFSGFGTEAGFHGTSFTSGISWCPWILGIFTIRRVIHFSLLETVLILFPGEYLPLSGAEISCKWGSGLLKSRLCFLTSKKHKQDYKQRGTTTWGEAQ